MTAATGLACDLPTKHGYARTASNRRRVAKRRFASGGKKNEKNCWRRKMTESEKRLIIDLWESRMKVEDIVRMLPCDTATARGYIKALRAEGVLTAEKHRGKELTREIIKTAYENGETNPYVLARTYHLSPYTVKDILVGFGLERQRPKRNYKKRNPTDIGKLCVKTQDICEEIAKGTKPKEITEKYGVTRQYVSLLKKKYFKNSSVGL